MNTDNINNFVDVTFTKVESTKLKPLTSIKGWVEQVKALVNLVPVFGGALAQEIQVMQNFKESEFFRKYTAYILGVADLPIQERKIFAEEIAQKARDSAGYLITGMVNRLDNINKEVILANLTRSRIDDKISIENFFRLASVLERIPYVDLVKLPSYQTPYYDEDGDTELLNSTGVLRPVKLSEDGDSYILSPLGVKLLSFGLNINIGEVNVTGTSVGVSWNDISEVSDVYMKNIRVNMDIKDFVTNYHTHPVLFIGTGMSMRYLQKSYSWKSLLEQITVDLTGNDEQFLNIDSRFNGDCPKMASEIEKIFNQKLEEDRNGKFKNINDIFFEDKRKGIDNSRFKIYISQLLADNSFKPEMLEEIKTLKTIRKNISSVITTNYDNLVEQVFQFDPLVGNNILLSNPYGAVYKIHGSIENPSSIIITAGDYRNFDTKYELIRAQLLSLFMHNPIIFIGYSLTDENIKKLLHTIFSYVNADSETAEKIRNNFLIIERDHGSENTEVIPFDIIVDNKNIRVNKIKTDNFTAVYQALSELRLPISAMDIRKVQDIVGDIYKGANGIKVEITEDLATLKNSDKVLAIGTDKTIKYQYQTSKELMVDYFSVIEEADEQRLSLIDKFKINKAQYFPIYGFCQINRNIKHEEALKKIQNHKIQALKDKVTNDKRYQNDHGTIQDILNDADIKPTYKTDAIAYSVLVKCNVMLDDLEDFLRGYEEKNTDYNKLLVVYDYLKYKE